MVSDPRRAAHPTFPRFPAATSPSRAGSWPARRAPRRHVSTAGGFGQLVAALAGRPEVGAVPGHRRSGRRHGHQPGRLHPPGGLLPRSGGEHDWNEADPRLEWRQTRRGQHLELGISEMNLFLLLGQLGLSWDLSDQPLLPIGTVYDPFVCRGLDAFVYATYSGARFVVAGTPAASPSRRRAAASIDDHAVDRPGTAGRHYCEPAYVGALDWLLCDALRRIARGEDGAPRTSGSPRGPWTRRRSRRPEPARARSSCAASCLPAPTGWSTPAPSTAPDVYLVGCGAVLPEVVAAAARLADQGVAAHVVDVTSPDRLYTTWRSGLRDDVRSGAAPRRSCCSTRCFPSGRRW